MRRSLAPLAVVLVTGGAIAACSSSSAANPPSPPEPEADGAVVDGTLADSASSDGSTSTTPDGSAATDSSALDGDATATDAGADGPPQICPPTPPAFSGGPITIVNVAANRPSPLGGPIEPGTYALTAWYNYTGPGGVSGPGGASTQMTMVFETVDFDPILVWRDGNASGQDLTTVGTYGAGGTMLTTTFICTSADAGRTYATLTYSATANTVSLYGTNDVMVLSR